MPRFYENLVARQEAALTRAQYKEASLLYQRLYGRLRYAWPKGAAAILLGAVFVISLFTGAYYPGEEIVGMALSFVAAVAGFGWLAYSFLIDAGKREADWAGRNYDSNPLPGMAEEILVYRDSFEVKNEYESMTGFWSECAGCCRRGDLLVVNTSANLSRPMLVFSRSAMPDGAYEKLCKHLASVFLKKYTVIGREGKG